MNNGYKLARQRYPYLREESLKVVAKNLQEWYNEYMIPYLKRRSDDECKMANRNLRRINRKF